MRSGVVKSNPPFSILSLNIMLPHNHIVGLIKQLLWAKCVKEIPHPAMMMTMMNIEMKIILMIMVMILMTWPPSVQWAAVSTSLELICKHGDGEELRKGGEDDDKVKDKENSIDYYDKELVRKWRLWWWSWPRFPHRKAGMRGSCLEVPPVPINVISVTTIATAIIIYMDLQNTCERRNTHLPDKDDNHHWHHLHLPRIFIFLRSGATDNLLDSVCSSAPYSDRDKA